MLYCRVIYVLALLYFCELSEQSERYRSDYEYHSVTNAFYKLHIETVIYRQAKEICELEGGKLVVALNQNEITQVHKLIKQYPDFNLVWAGDDGQQHESEEVPLIDIKNTEAFDYDCEVFTRSGEIEKVHCYRSLPFVCKVDAKDVYYDSQCKVAGIGYQFNPSTRSCYKVPNYAYNWNSAFEDCRAQGAHLVVLNSNAEAEAVKNIILPISNSNSIKEAHTHYFFYAGFRAERGMNKTERVFKTIFNETLAQAGYSEWSAGEPNNARDKEYCGSIFVNGKLNDVDCNEKFAYVCEVEVTEN